ncbi:MAG: polysaccharide biosynthesis tyrosine autokinase [Vulcanimicrobiota bacterium]
MTKKNNTDTMNKDFCNDDRTESYITFKDIISFLRRRWKVFCIIFLISFCLSLLFFYGKSERILIEPKTPFEAKLKMALVRNSLDYRTLDDVSPYSMMIEIIKSRPVLEKSLEKISKDKTFAIGNPDEYVNAVQIPSTNIIVVSVKHLERVFAEEFVNTLAETSIVEFQEQQDRRSQLARKYVISNIHLYNKALSLKKKSQAISENRFQQLWNMAYFRQYLNEKHDWNKTLDVIMNMNAIIRNKELLAILTSPPVMYAEIIERPKTSPPLLLPEDPGKKNKKSWKIIIIQSFILGIFMALSGTLIIERFDRRIHSEKDLIKCAPVSLLATVPMLSGKDAQSVFSQEGEVTKGSDAIRKLRSFIMARDEKILMVVGSIPNEGTSTVATNLAISLALSGKRTLLIDADLRNSTVHKLLKIPEKPGLADYIVGDLPIDSIVSEVTWVSNLSVITAGSLPSNPGIILESNKWKGLMDILKERYDYIVFDTAPIQNHPDALILKSSVNSIEGALLVCANEETSKSVMKNSIEVMRLHRIPVMGIILNKVS